MFIWKQYCNLISYLPHYTYWIELTLWSPYRHAYWIVTLTFRGKAGAGIQTPDLLITRRRRKTADIKQTRLCNLQRSIATRRIDERLSLKFTTFHHQSAVTWSSCTPESMMCLLRVKPLDEKTAASNHIVSAPRPLWRETGSALLFPWKQRLLLLWFNYTGHRRVERRPF